MSALPTPPPGRSLAGTYLRMLGATAIWAVTFHVGHYTAQHADPLGVAFLRFLFAGLTLAGIAVLRGQSLRITRAQLPLVLALAIPGVVAYTLFFLASVQSISGTRAALITAGSPVMVELASIVLLGTAASASRWTGIVLRCWARRWSSPAATYRTWPPPSAAASCSRWAACWPGRRMCS